MFESFRIVYNRFVESDKTRYPSFNSHINLNFMGEGESRGHQEPIIVEKQKEEPLDQETLKIIERTQSQFWSITELFESMQVLKDGELKVSPVAELPPRNSFTQADEAYLLKHAEIHDKLIGASPEVWHAYGKELVQEALKDKTALDKFENFFRILQIAELLNLKEEINYLKPLYRAALKKEMDRYRISE